MEWTVSNKNWGESLETRASLKHRARLTVGIAWPVSQVIYDILLVKYTDKYVLNIKSYIVAIERVKLLLILQIIMIKNHKLVINYLYHSHDSRIF